MAYPYDFNKPLSSSSFPSLSSGGGGGGGSSFPSLSSLGSGWGGGSNFGGTVSNTDRGNVLGQFGQGSPLTGFRGSSGGSSASGAAPKPAAWQSQTAAASPLSGYFSGSSGAAKSGGGFQPGGITGGPGQGATPFNTPLANLFNAANNAGVASGGAAGASSSFQMPSGFGQGVFGVNPNASGAAPAQQQSGYNAQNGGVRSSPAALTPANNKAINGKTVTQGSLTYTPLANSNSTASATPPKLSTLGSSVDPSTSSVGIDQYGREFVYAKSLDGTGGTVVGVSANGTVLKQIRSSDGQLVTYDTGATASTKPAPAPKSTPAPTIPAKPQGVPVGVTQKSTPVVQTQPSAADIEKQRRDSGYYLQ